VLAMSDDTPEPPITLQAVIIAVGVGLVWTYIVSTVSHWSPWIVAGAVLIAVLMVIPLVAAWRKHPVFARNGRFVVSIVAAAIIAAYVQQTTAKMDSLTEQLNDSTRALASLRGHPMATPKLPTVGAPRTSAPTPKIPERLRLAQEVSAFYEKAKDLGVELTSHTSEQRVRKEMDDFDADVLKWTKDNHRGDFQTEWESVQKQRPYQLGGEGFRLFNPQAMDARVAALHGWMYRLR